MDDKDFQKKSLESIFRVATFAPLFEPHPRHCINQFAGFTPYISFKDLINKRIYIRACPIGNKNSNDTGERRIIITYSNIDELVEDGWRLG